MTRTRKSKRTQLERQYFRWLCNQIDRRGGNEQHRDLASTLFDTTFKPIIPNDDNRAIAGIELRDCFAVGDNLNENDVASLLNGPCSMLEMLVALAQKMNYQLMELPDDGDRTAKWFWLMVDNLGLKTFSCDDPDAERKQQVNALILKKLNERTYAPNGRGGLFPLKRPQQDQRQVEIWYQMMAYIGENYAI